MTKRGNMEYSSNLKEVKEFGFAKSVLYNFVLSIFITIAVMVIAVYVFQLRLDIVLSDSMSPTFYKDDIVVIKQCDDYEVKDIVEYRLSKVSKPVTHRIQEKKIENGKVVYVTKGDAADGFDTITIDQINGKVICVIQDGKNIYEFIKSNYFLFIDILLGAWVLTSVLTNESEMRKHNIAEV
ncbi:MAG: signal peptidase I [Clostridia bacterium]